MGLMRRRVSRRSLLKKSVGGLFVVGPLLQASVLEASAYNLCDCITWKTKRAYCQGTTWVIEEWGFDCYNPYYDCGKRIYRIFPNSPNCTDDEEIVSLANSLIVSTELGYGGDDYGMLRARASSQGPWERFGVFPLDPNNVDRNQWYIQAKATGLFVSAEIGDAGTRYGMLRARASQIGQWENFALTNLGGSRYAIQSYANGLYVSAELGYGGGYYGMLRARASVVGQWELFSLDPAITGN